MLGSNHVINKRVHTFTRMLALLLPVMVLVTMLSQTVFAKNTYLINDGGRVTVHTTYTTDPAEVLDEAGLELGKDDTYTTQPGFGVSEITIQRMQTVQVVYGGNTLFVSTYGETVEEMLDRLGIKVAEGDLLSESLATMSYDGMILTITRTMTVEETYTVLIPYETEYCYDPTLAEGEQVVLTAGAEGSVLRTDIVHYANGEEKSRVCVSETAICQPVTELIAIGTRVELPEYPYVENPEEKPDQPTLEGPPVSNMPIIGENTITTPEGDVLTFTHSEQFVATAYHNSDPGCTIWTAIGTLCRVGAIAVDPKVIPYGTRMYIVTNDGKYIYGVAVAEDCGSAIKGNRVDLYFDSVPECDEFGIRDCTIYFLG